MFRVWGTAWGSLWKNRHIVFILIARDPWGNQKLLRINEIRIPNGDSNRAFGHPENLRKRKVLWVSHRFSLITCVRDSESVEAWHHGDSGRIARPLGDCNQAGLYCDEDRFGAVAGIKLFRNALEVVSDCELT